MTEHIKGRLFGGAILLLEFGLLFAYGFEGLLFDEPTDAFANSVINFLYFATLILAVLGFGLQLSYFQSTGLTAIFQSLFVVSLTTIFLPPMMQFWYNVYIGSFDGTIGTSTNSFLLFNRYHDHDETEFQASFFYMRITLFCCLSQLVALHAFFGKINLLATLLFSFIFQCGWVFTFYLCISIARNSPADIIYDDYLAANVYVFGSIFGVVLAAILPKPDSNHEEARATRISTILALVGTFFVFASFACSTFFFPQRLLVALGTTSFFGFNAGTMNMFFAMSASMISSLVITLLVSQRVNIRVVIWASIMGAILFSSVGNTADNITIPISTGFVAGIISGIFIEVINPKINRNSIFDSYGLLGTFLVNSILAAFFIAPLVLIGMTNTGANFLSLGNVALSNRDQAGWVLIYFALSLGFGAVTAAGAGLFIRCLSSGEREDDLLDFKIFDNDYGLYDDPEQVRGEKIRSRDNIESGDAIGNRQL